MSPLLLAESARMAAGPEIWVPLASASIYAISAMLLKRAREWSVDVWRTTFLSNMVCGLMFQPLLLLGGQIPLELLWQPLIIGALFVVGQITCIIALMRGEISIAAPVLGLKIVMVPFIAVALTGKPLPEIIWIASAVATAGVVMLNVTDQHGKRGSVWISVIFAAIGAAAFSQFDVCLQLWTPHWGVGRILPLSYIASSLLSLALLPLFPASLAKIPRPAWPWLIVGCLLAAIQAVGIAGSVAWYGKAAESNVAYSTRGLWGVVMIWFLGPTLGVADASLSRKVIWFRLAGAALLLGAIALLVFQPA